MAPTVLHEVAGKLGEAPVVQSVSSCPLPRDIMGQAYTLPRYVVIEPPLTLGTLTEFNPEVIRLNVALGELVARYTRVGFLDQGEATQQGGLYVHPRQNSSLSEDDLERLKREAILQFLESELARWRQIEQNPPQPALPPGFDRMDINTRKRLLQAQATARQQAQEKAQKMRVFLEKAYEKYEAVPEIIVTRRSPGI